MQEVTRLEEEFCKFTGYKYAVAVNTGTAGLHLALLALKSKIVLVPDFTMASCLFAINYVGARPVFADCGKDYNMVLDEKPMFADTIMKVHIYGRESKVNTYGLKVIEDMSEAHGIKPTGDIAVYSLYQNKIVCAEEGGIIVTNNKDYADNMRDLKNMAFGDGHNFYHTRIGFNYRMANHQAKLALKSLHDVEENLKKRKQVNDWYNEFLEHDIQHDVDWVHDFLVEDNSIVDKIPEARYFFKPLSSFPMYKTRTGDVYEISKHGMYLPIKPEFTRDYVEYICNEVNKCVIFS